VVSTYEVADVCENDEDIDEDAGKKEDGNSGEDADEVISDDPDIGADIADNSADGGVTEELCTSEVTTLVANG
jgi:hypothetical protein